MRLKYLGDSYDIVKQSLLRWLGHFGEWAVHPMFTESVTDADVKSFEALLGARIISKEVLSLESKREDYFAPAAFAGNIFMDPDTGLRLQDTRSVRAPEFLFMSDLLRGFEPRPNKLTLVFDQSVGRGSEREHLERKIAALRQQDLFGTAYVSHACFLLVSKDRSIIEEARRHMIQESRLPESRFLNVPG